MERPSIPADKSAIILDPGALVEDGVLDAVREHGFSVERCDETEAACVRLFKRATQLCIIGHHPPSADAASIVRALRRAQDCASRQAAYFVVVRDPNLELIGAMRNAGVSQLAVAPLGATRLHTMFGAMASDTRRFIEAKEYVGPDRRVRQLTTFGFTLKRQRDYAGRQAAYSAPLPDGLVRSNAA